MKVLRGSYTVYFRFPEETLPLAFDILKNRQTFFTRAILLLLALTFVIGFGYAGGISIGGRGPSGGTAVEVNGEKVPVAQFFNLRDALTRRQRETNPEISAQLADFISFTAMDTLVNRKLLAQEAAQVGIRVSDGELSRAITTDPAFQVDGAFVGSERYADYVSRGLNQTVGQFEEAYKDELLARKLLSVVESSVTATDEELFALYRMNAEEIDLWYVSFSAGDYSEDLEISEEEILEYHEENRDLFVEPETRAARYVKVSPADFASGVEVPEEELRAYYETYTDEFVAEGGRKPFSEVGEEIEKRLVEDRAAVLYDRFVEEFLGAKRPSLDGLLEEIGPLEVKETGDFVLEDAGEDVPGSLRRKAFSVEEGGFSGAVHRDFTWFFEVTAVNPSRPAELSSVREDVEKALREKKSLEAAREAAGENLSKLAAGGNFEKTAASLGLSPAETGFFGRSRPPLAVDAPEFVSEIFGLDSARPTPDRVYESGSSFYLVSLKEKKPAAADAFEKEKDSFRQRWTESRRNRVLEGLLERARKTSTIRPNADILPQSG